MQRIRTSALALLVLAVQLFTQQAVAQDEVLVNLSSYPISKPTIGTKNAKAEPLTLPCFDDFSRNEALPSQNLWQNSGVMSNLNYAISPITIGTATFDAIGSNGELYQGLTTFPQIADGLTSQPINLELTTGDSIYLSFYIQPQGLGYAPSQRDSLVLELLDSTNQWQRVWAASVNFADSTLTQYLHLSNKKSSLRSNSLNKTFHQVMIPITDEKFMTKNFQLRFLNYASIAQNQNIAGLLSNCDHWILDLVYLNSHRTVADTTFDDIAFNKPISLLMNNYTSIPWKHIQNAYSNEFNSPLGFTISYSNLGYNTWNVTRRFSIIDHSGHTANYNFSGGAENIFEKQEVEYTRNFEYNFASAWDDSAKFTLKSYLITDDNASTLHLRNNDTIQQNLNFHNFYAYDDGSAESGYGIYGEGTSNAMVAYKFNNYVADSIKGVMVYFNRTVNDGNETSFKLTIWDDNNGKPGNIIAQRAGTRTLYSDSLNQFTIYRITPTLLPEGTFYVGWVQVYECMMNVGFDLSNNNSDKIFLNLGSGWTNTKFEGSLMIRPILGNMHQWPTNIICNDNKTSSFTLYPNPASNSINLKFAGDQAPVMVQIISTSGQVVLQTSTTQQVNIQSLTNGLYIVKALMLTGNTATQKLLINR